MRWHLQTSDLFLLLYIYTDAGKIHGGGGGRCCTKPKMGNIGSMSVLNPGGGGGVQGVGGGGGWLTPDKPSEINSIKIHFRDNIGVKIVLL